MEWDQIHEDARKESLENQERLWHNVFCDDLDQLRPYRAEKFLKVVDAVVEALEQ